MEFRTLKRNLAKDFAGLKPVRLALIGDAPTQLLATALRGLAYEHGIDLRIFDAGIDQFETLIFDPASELYAFAPRHVVLYHSAERFLERLAGTTPDTRPALAATRAAEISRLWEALSAQGLNVIQLTAVELDDGVWGSFSARAAGSARSQLRRLNLALEEAAATRGQVLFADLAGWQADQGRAALFDPQLYYSSNLTIRLEALPEIARLILDVVRAAEGDLRKALVLDLDDTIWGGIVGEDGVENLEVGGHGVGHAFADVQVWARQLRERGVLLAVCSKNDEALAREAFERHPGMVLGLSDIAVFMANWETKVDNLQAIASAMNIGLDALVFLDDNPFEREMVRKLLPQVVVPELPADPGERPAFLRAARLFETASVSASDAKRTAQIQAVVAAEQARGTFASVDEYLDSLEMAGEVLPFTPVWFPRIAQLTQRSNQFNLRTVRYGEADVSRIAAAPDYVGLAFTLKDVHADHGLIGVVILAHEGVETAFVDTWLMSCRVLKRGMEHFMLAAVVEAARVQGYQRLTAEYLPTSKNGLVKDLLATLGFTPGDGRWHLDLAAYEPTACRIARRGALV